MTTLDGLFKRVQVKKKKILKPQVQNSQRKNINKQQNKNPDSSIKSVYSINPLRRSWILKFLYKI